MPTAGADEAAPWITFYGDDFTGASDALAQFHRFGLRGLLLFRLAPVSTLAALAVNMDVIGIAGISRSLPTCEMETEIRPVFETFARLGSRVVQYKVCSTFDSSPSTGSIGRVIEIGRSIFGSHPIPVLAAQPEFGRFTVFGTHFARADDRTVRLDRHPTMACHPATPMDEADLGLHLRRQTGLPVVNFDVLTLSAPIEEATTRYRQLCEHTPGAIVIDALEQWHLARTAELIMPDVRQPPLFAVGSGGLSYGIGAYLAHRGRCTPIGEGGPQLSAVDRLLVVSGSCAPQTAEQIQWAISHGWYSVRILPEHLLTVAGRDAVCAEVLQALDQANSVIVYTALGPNDQAIASIRAALTQHADRPSNSAEHIGRLFGYIVQAAIERAHVRRLIVAGGDTSGYTMRALDAFGLEVERQLVVAGTVCRLRSTNPAIEGVHVMLKGGQVGDCALFETVRAGRQTAP